MAALDAPAHNAHLYVSRILTNDEWSTGISLAAVLAYRILSAHHIVRDLVVVVLFEPANDRPIDFRTSNGTVATLAFLVRDRKHLRVHEILGVRAIRRVRDSPPKN